MALAVAQARKIESGSAQSVTVNNAWTVAGGSLLVAHIASGVGTNTGDAASGSVNGSYTAIAATGQGSANFARSSHHYKANSTAGLENLTATVSSSIPGGGFGGVTGIFHEVTGASTTVPFTTGEQANATYVATTNPQTAGVLNSVASSIFFAEAANESGANPSTYTVNSTGSSPTGWATFDSSNSQELNGASFWVINVAYLIVSSGASTVHGWTTNNNKGVYCIAAFGAAAGGGAAAAPVTHVQKFMGW